MYNAANVKTPAASCARTPGQPFFMRTTTKPPDERRTALPVNYMENGLIQ